MEVSTWKGIKNNVEMTICICWNNKDQRWMRTCACCVWIPTLCSTSSFKV